MLTLNLGVIEIPYENAGAKPAPKRVKKGRKKRSTAKQVESDLKNEDAAAAADGPTTTLTVARILEEKYGVMAAFYGKHQDDIAQTLINSMEGALENLYMGHPVHDPYAEAGQEIGSAFKLFLSTAEIESMGIDGVPTQAAIERRSLRFKSKTANAQRPSFVDTGTYEASMQAWVE